MEHLCKDSDLTIIKQEGDLILYKCKVCNKEIEALVCMPLPKEYYDEEKAELIFEWSNDMTIQKQIIHLLKIFPTLKDTDRNKLLKQGKSNEALLIGEYYVSECDFLIEEGKKKGLKFFRR